MISWGRREAYGVFFALAATVYTVVFFASRFDAAVRRPAAMGAAGLADLIVTVPLLYYFLIVRPGLGSWTSLAAVCVAGARAAGIVLTPGERAFLPASRWLGVPLELIVVWALVRRVRQMEAEADAVSRLREAARVIIRKEWLSEIVAAELAVFYYALFSWRARPQIPTGCRAFTYAEASGHRMLAMIMGAAVVFEGVPMHLLLRHWSPTAAWVCTGLDAYALVWTVALARSIRLRPMLVSVDRVVVRIGLLYEAELPRRDIAACRRASATDTGKGPGHLRAVVLNEPQWVLELNAGVLVRGPFGRRRTITAIALAVDEPGEFASALSPCNLLVCRSALRS